MEPQPADPEGPAPSVDIPARAPTNNGRLRPRAARLWPLAALTLSTVLLTASAVRVVGSSLVEEFAERERVASLPIIIGGSGDRVGPSPGDAGLDLDLDQAEKFALFEPDRAVPGPPRPAPKSPRPPAPSAPPGRPTPAPPLAEAEARRVLVRDPAGQPIVARVYGRDEDRTAVLLPDGQIGWPDGLVYTERPFVPAPIDEVRRRLLAADFAGFESIKTRHYLVIYQGTPEFAQASAGLLEDLYAGMIDTFKKHGIPAHQAEFPLVAVIFRTEGDFRRHKRVAPDVQAYYEILTNRIYLYETSRRDQGAPEVTALRKPQTVAHEGAHQVLQNIGVQPRLADWPLWLVEGLAEYCATPKFGKNGAATWSGLGQINLLHVATIRDLDDPLSSQVRGAGGPVVARDKGRSIVESLVRRTELTPTDYALAWGLTFHLATKRADDFLGFLREMSTLKPLETRSPDDQLRTFRGAFNDPPAKLDLAVVAHLRRLKQIDALPHYAVFFEQPLPGNAVRRAAMVSQSPSMIRQWIESTTSPRGGEPHWQAIPHPTKARALLTVEQWIGGS